MEKAITWRITPSGISSDSYKTYANSRVYSIFEGNVSSGKKDFYFYFLFFLIGVVIVMYNIDS